MTTAFHAYEPSFFSYYRGMSTNMPRPHFHKNYEIYYLISGKRRYFIENSIFDVFPGDIILIPEMVTHKTIDIPGVAADACWERFLLSPTKEEIPELLLPCFETHFYHLPNDAQKTVYHCLQSLQSFSQKHDKFTESYNRAILTEILCTIARLPTSSQKTLPLSKTDALIQQAAVYIRNHYSEKITLADLAERYSFSKEYFSVLFKKITGFGFNEYLNHIRITSAISLLTTTKISVAAISEQCGFNDSNYFSEVFKKITGMTPRNFRNDHIEESLANKRY